MPRGRSGGSVLETFQNNNIPPFWSSLAKVSIGQKIMLVSHPASIIGVEDHWDLWTYAESRLKQDGAVYPGGTRKCFVGDAEGGRGRVCFITSERG